MIEYITVSITIVLLLAGWFAAWIVNEKSVIKGAVLAIGLPLLFAAVIAIVVYVIYSFTVVFGNI